MHFLTARARMWDRVTTEGAEIWRPYYLALLAETYGKAGQSAEGLRLLTEALALADRLGEHWWKAELYRLKGELSLAQEGTSRNAAQAEQCFQQAKSLELRAAMSLARLWQQQGKSDTAHQLLARSYGWFTEGFATADLREAQALLQGSGTREVHSTVG